MNLRERYAKGFAESKQSKLAAALNPKPVVEVPLSAVEANPNFAAALAQLRKEHGYG